MTPSFWKNQQGKRLKTVPTDSVGSQSETNFQNRKLIKKMNVAQERKMI